jgi:hypothetical protein
MSITFLSLCPRARPLKESSHQTDLGWDGRGIDLIKVGTGEHDMGWIIFHHQQPGSETMLASNLVAEGPLM